MTKSSTADIVAADLSDWRKLAQGLHARFLISNFPIGAAFVGAVADAAESIDHHPDLRLSYGRVDILLCTHDEGRWVTEKDLSLARTISAIAADRGLTPAPSEVAQLEMALDTAHEDLVGPFWSALLTGSPENKMFDSVLDPTDRVPNVWFQPTDEHETPRQRWHHDLWLAPETVAPRIAAAVAAGGTVVDERGAPSFVVLADPDGNEFCLLRQ